MRKLTRIAPLLLLVLAGSLCLLRAWVRWLQLPGLPPGRFPRIETEVREQGKGEEAPRPALEAALGPLPPLPVGFPAPGEELLENGILGVLFRPWLQGPLLLPVPLRLLLAMACRLKFSGEPGDHGPRTGLGFDFELRRCGSGLRVRGAIRMPELPLENPRVRARRALVRAFFRAGDSPRVFRGKTLPLWITRRVGCSRPGRRGGGRPSPPSRSSTSSR